jgi:hypothetical protein
MPKLELQFNCLCLFVPDRAAKVVHVLMPGTNGHEGHGGHEKHVVRMLHHGFEGQEKLTGRCMEGWALTLGPEHASADTSLRPRWDADQDPVRPAWDADQGAVLPDLSELTGGRTVHRSLLGKVPEDRVAARITLRSGGVARMASEATWEIGGKDFALAHQVTWTMDIDDELRWEGLNDRPDDHPKPLEKLEDLEPEDDGKPDDDVLYRLRIFHVTEDALPPRGGTLHPAVMRAHYRAFYPLLGEDYPGDELLPRMKSTAVLEVNCAAGSGRPG